MWRLRVLVLTFILCISGQDVTLNGDADAENIVTNPENITSPMDAYNSIFGQQGILQEELRNEHWQWLVVLVAFTLGTAAVVDGAELFKWLVLAGWFVISYILAMGQLHAKFNIEQHAGFEGNLLWMMIASAEVAMLAVFIAYVSWEGVKVMLGVGTGTAIASGIIRLLASHGGNTVVDNHTFIVILYTICVLFGIWMFYFSQMMFRGRYFKAPGQNFYFKSRGPGWLLGIASSLVGGKVIASVCCWAIMWIAMKCAKDNESLNLPEKMPFWIDFWDATNIPPSGTEVGIFATSKWSDTKLDFVIGYCLWLVFFVCGAFNQHRIRKKSENEDKENRAQAEKSGRIEPFQGAGPPVGSFYDKYRGKTDENMSTPLINNQL